MLTKLCAACVVVLALSPFTAPFRTWDVGDSPGGSRNETVSVAATTSITVSLADDAGSLIAPLATKARRLRLAPLSGVVLAKVGATSLVAVPETPVASANRVTRYSVLSTVFRL